MSLEAFDTQNDPHPAGGGEERPGAVSPPAAPDPSSPWPLVAVVPVLALAACGDGSSSTQSPAAPAAPPPPAPAPITGAQASRMLAQATMGATTAQIDLVRSRGFEAWLNDQFDRPRATSFWNWLLSHGYNSAGARDAFDGFDPMMWSQLIGGQDQLRQRVGMALLEFLVVGINSVFSIWRPFGMAAYLDILWDNAFGNFRTILGLISTNGSMASALTFLGNRRATGSALPDENYARELMQLFTIGLYRLNPDGTQQLSGGQPIDTYRQEDVSGLARVFTGWDWDSTDVTTPDRLQRPLVQVASRHELGEKTFLGTTIPAGTDGVQSLRLALDAIFAHPNVPPFVSRQLIQRLVTSNPSPAYVQRVAARFADNGSGVRGDLRAVIRAILLDAEARDDSAAAASTSFGKVREPILRLTGWARGFGATSPSDSWAIGDTSSQATRLAQSPGRSPSVFNFFRPGYTPPNTAIATGNLVAPEFQITNEASTVAYLNYIRGLIANGAGDLRGDYAALIAKASDSQALLDDINLLIAAGQVSAATIAQIRTAVDSIATTPEANLNNRVLTAIFLVMASPEYLILK